VVTLARETQSSLKAPDLLGINRVRQIVRPVIANGVVGPKVVRFGDRVLCRRQLPGLCIGCGKEAVGPLTTAIVVRVDCRRSFQEGNRLFVPPQQQRGEA